MLNQDILDRIMNLLIIADEYTFGIPEDIAELVDGKIGCSVCPMEEKCNHVDNDVDCYNELLKYICHGRES